MSQEQTTKDDLPDIQNQKDNRSVSLDRVGISNRKVKATIPMKDGGRQPIEMEVVPVVNLPEENKGIHMSRLLESFYNDGKDVNLDLTNLPHFDHEELVTQAWDILSRQDATSVELKANFEYQMVKEAPASGKEAPVPYDVNFTVRASEDGETEKFIGVEVVGTSLCPCSKEISNYGAHNQRSIVELIVKTDNEYDGTVWIEDIVRAVEEQFSEEIYALLKREDEKAVTEGAYENPKFVEDISRDVVNKFQEEFSDQVEWVDVTVENEESIHNHNAYAQTQEMIGGKGEE